MKGVKKNRSSAIVTSGLKYPADRTQIRQVLISEQGGYCAYTEYYIGVATAVDVEHFNPTLKGTPADCYGNWFEVSHKWNLMKGASSRWHDFQPILHPTNPDFDSRIIFDTRTGTYFAKNDDNEAENLVKYLFLDNPELSSERIKTLENLSFLSDKLEHSDFEIFVKKLKPNFRRTIETVFNIQL